jgi:SEC-C motif-containing protein
MSRKPAANAACPCGSGRNHKACCGPILNGEPARSPEALMRSRYVAWAFAQIGYLMRTTDPAGPHHGADGPRWASELAASAASTRFTGLEVRSSSEDGDHGEVRFVASFVANGRAGRLAEHSRFRRVAGRWLWTDGAPFDPDADPR